MYSNLPFRLLYKVVYVYGCQTSLQDTIGVPASPHIVTSQFVDLLHILLAQLEIKDLDILLNSLLCFAFWQNYEMVLQGPSQTYLRDALFVFQGQGFQKWVFQQQIIVPGERGICFDSYAVLSAKIDGWALPQQWMYLKLIDCRFYLGISQQVFQMPFEIITHPNIFHFPFLLQLNQSLPSFPPNQSVLDIISRDPLNSRPMNYQQVNIGSIQSLQDILTCFFSILVPLLSSMDLACYINLASLYLHLFENFADLYLIAIYAGRVYMRISALQRPLQAIRTILSFKLIRSIADNGNIVSCTFQFDGRYLLLHQNQNVQLFPIFNQDITIDEQSTQIKLVSQYIYKNLLQKYDDYE